MTKQQVLLKVIAALVLALLAVPITSLAGIRTAEQIAVKRVNTRQKIVKAERQVANHQERYCGDLMVVLDLPLPPFCATEAISDSLEDVPLLISEVYYKVDGAYGAETTNEWFEVYNDSNSYRDLSGYIVTDANSSDILPDGSVVQPGGYLIVTNSTTTLDFWTIPDSATIVYLNNPIGNGLANNGDVIILKDAVGNLLDSVSWGNNTSAFNPSVSNVALGSSIVRTDPVVDTNTQNDWSENFTPSPGQ